MKHQITWRSKHKDSSMENWIEKKVPTLEKYFKNEAEDKPFLEITVDDGQKKPWKTVMNLKFNGINFYSDTESRHFVKALDNTLMEIKRQVTEHFDKFKAKKRSQEEEVVTF